MRARLTHYYRRIIFAQLAKQGAVTICDNTLTGRDLQLRQQTIPLDQITELTPHKSLGVNYLLVQSGDSQIAIYRQSQGFDTLQQTLVQALQQPLKETPPSISTTA